MDSPPLPRFPLATGQVSFIPGRPRLVPKGCKLASVRKQEGEVPVTLSPSRKPDSAAGSWTRKGVTERRNQGWQGRKGSHIVPDGFTLSPDGDHLPLSLPSQRRKKGAVWAGFSLFNSFFLSGDSLHNEGGAGQGADPRGSRTLPKLARDSGASPPPAGCSWYGRTTGIPELGREEIGVLRQPANVLKFLKNLGWVLYEKLSCVGRKSLSQASNECTANSQLT